MLALRLSSVMCAPLVSQGHVQGVLYVGNDRVKGLFDRNQLDVLSIFAAQASLILQNAMLLNALRADKEKLVAELKDKRFGEIIGACPSMLEVFRKLQKVADDRHLGPHHGRDGHRQGAHRARDPPADPPRERPVHRHQLRRHPREPHRERALRPREGRVHGRLCVAPGKFQVANRGTLFLDEIGELPLNLQVKLLRALQERVVFRVGDSKPEKVDIRIVAATNRVLEEEIRAGRFREDLYYRLNVVNIYLPPLRERGDDVLIIAKALLSKHAEELGAHVQGFTPRRSPPSRRPLARQHPAAREPHQEGARALRQVAALARGPRSRQGRREPHPAAREGEGGIPAQVRARGARAQQRQPHADGARSRRRSAHHLPLPREGAEPDAERGRRRREGAAGAGG